MKKNITFITDLFESKEVKAHFVNDRCFGEDLAHWLVEKSKGSEFVFGEPFQEDWGWAVFAEANSEKFVIGFGIMDESIGEVNADWTITVDKMRKWMLFGSNDSPLRARLCDLIQNILRNEPEIREVRWED